ncbi:putative PIN and TRAM-domain containing protein precursor [Sedimentisphaera cyanobacteriorum]|uniref:Putative PIN and TRAM-domain containing protein n=1 Tax=Sedimentisphaera cyanobacteriorum TaxID=1940790 RepID=A0A1Q2HRA6_9BACT|nr:TRAM domain-containing protein [Sedimentisphaera cyanobacteriorum]AQQ09998.1 putative PIN and TRAM-domain containing protein precursor [Sedimentisphaera cyanobacteriorum]
MLLYFIRGLFFTIILAVLFLAIDNAQETGVLNQPKLLTGYFLAMILAIVVIVIDWLTPKKHLSSLTSIFFGLLVGMLISSAITPVISTVNDLYNIGMNEQALGTTRWIVSICICYLTISIVMRTKDDVRFVIPYVEFSRQTKGVRPLVLDSSVIVDGRIFELAQTKVFDAPFIVPRFILNELQLLSDSPDKLKRTRGRRGLDMIAQLQSEPVVEINIDDTPPPGIEFHAPVDQKLVAFTKNCDGRLVTTDYNLGKVAMVRQVDVVNINDIAKAIKPVVLPGEPLKVRIIKKGEERKQGIGYLEDGTMVVVEETSDMIGETVPAIVTSSLQTSAGRMIFAKFEPAEHAADQSRGKPAQKS